VSLQGLQWPLDASGKRSSAPAGKEILAAALRGLDADAAAALRAERHWRQAYARHVRVLVERQAARPNAVVESSRAGLDAAWSALPFVREGREQALADAMARPTARFASTTLVGEGEPAPARWEVPYRGKRLHGEALARQIDRWQADGVAEPGHCDALRRLLAHPEWFDLSDRRFVLLGAGSEAGPLAWLARWRAQIVAVDLPRAATWKRIAATVKAGNATLIAPQASASPSGASDDITACGADLLTQTPEIAAWLVEQGQGAPGPRAALDVGHIAYLDGERHVRVSLAMDAIGATVSAHDARTTLAFMATPTDLFAVPEALAETIRRRYGERGLVKRLAQAGVRAGSKVLGATSFVPHIAELITADDGSRWGVVDAVVLEQGPNYLLAKRLQQWRAWIARAAGQQVAMNVAPSTSTASVVSNKLLAAGFRGAKAFDVEVFEPATTNALMAGMWVHDLRHREATVAPNRHPLAAIAESANHGGLWRVPYLPRSVLPTAALLGLVKRRA
jgi:hypothetical protein